jgi:predicted aspartyl protease
MKNPAKLICGMLVLLPLHATTGCSQIMHRSPPPPERVELRTAKTAIPMDLFGGRPVVSVRINGKGPFPFILDTGAGGTVVNLQLARELGLPDKGQTLAGRPGAATPVPASVTQVDQLELGEAEVSGLFAVSLDLSTVLTGDQAPRGVLSAASFPGLLITFDYPEKSVELQRGDLPPADGQTIFSWEAGDRVPAIPIALNDLRLKVDLDSGSASGISLPQQYADVLHLASKPLAAPVEKTVDGQRKVIVATLDGVAKIGQFTIRNPQIRFVEDIPSGNIGSEILRQFAVTLDTKNRRIRLEPAPRR